MRLSEARRRLGRVIDSFLELREGELVVHVSHGIARYRTAYPDVYSVPKLGGQSAAYLSNALHAYKAKQRSHPSMRALALMQTIRGTDRERPSRLAR